MSILAVEICQKVKNKDFFTIFLQKKMKCYIVNPDTLTLHQITQMKEGLLWTWSRSVAVDFAANHRNRTGTSDKGGHFLLDGGILSGTLIYSCYTASGAGIAVKTVENTFTLMAEKLGENVKIILFLCLLGALVAVVSKAGGSAAYGAWAAES